MRLGLLIKDIDYRDALVRKLSNYDNDIFVNIIGKSGNDTSGCLVLTDIKPEEIDAEVLSRLKRRIVFLTDADPVMRKDGGGNRADAADPRNDLHFVFKYCNVQALISELSLVYNEWHGTGPRRDYSAKLISVCSEYDAFSSEHCLSLARQIVYRNGGKVLVIPLSYINDYCTDEKEKINRLARLLYMVRTGRERDSESFTYTDSYGISALMLPPGQNPVAYLEEEELGSLITALASRFNTVILDIGSCFRKENLSVMKSSDFILFYETGRRDLRLGDMIGAEAYEKVMRIKVSDDSEGLMAIDDCIRRMYGADGEEGFKSDHGKKTRGGDR